MLIIGIGYAKHSGKDTFARFLIEHQPFAVNFNPLRIAFADALKSEFAGIMDTTTEEIENNKELWRPGLQWYSLEYTQKILDKPNYWINRIKERLPYLIRMGHRCVIIPDMRFLHDVEFVKSQGGILVNVTRPMNRLDKHLSETSLNDFQSWDYVIENNGTLNELKKKTANFADEIIHKKVTEQPKVSF